MVDINIPATAAPRILDCWKFWGCSPAESCRRWRGASRSAGYSWGTGQISRTLTGTRRTPRPRCSRGGPPCRCGAWSAPPPCCGWCWRAAPGRTCRPGWGPWSRPRWCWAGWRGRSPPPSCWARSRRWSTRRRARSTSRAPPPGAGTGSSTDRGRWNFRSLLKICRSNGA